MDPTESISVIPDGIIHNCYKIERFYFISEDNMMARRVLYYELGLAKTGSQNSQHRTLSIPCYFADNYNKTLACTECYFLIQLSTSGSQWEPVLPPRPGDIWQCPQTLVVSSGACYCCLAGGGLGRCRASSSAQDGQPLHPRKN